MNLITYFFPGSYGMEEQTNSLATSTGYNSTVAKEKCVSVTPYVKVYVHWEVFMERCVNLRLGMEYGVEILVLNEALQDRG
jgi:hypothetical protein